MIKNKEVNAAYSMLLKHPWLIDANVNHDLDNNLVINKGNGTVKTVSVNQRKGPTPKLPEVVVSITLLKVSRMKKKNVCYLPSRTSWPL